MKGGVKVSQKVYCQKQRGGRGGAVLETVLEHCEVPSTAIGGEGGSVTVVQGGACSKRGRPMRVLLRLRDGYVKLMNEMSMGVDLSGVSSFYGCSGGDNCPVRAMAHSRLLREGQEREIMLLQALQVQRA